MTFGTPANAPPFLRIEHPQLGVRSVRLVFLGEHVASSNELETVVFDTPSRPLPFGERLHEDLTFLPGVETLVCFGHEIEILPRVLTVNRKELPWQAEMTIELSPDQKVPPRVKKKKRR